MEKEKLITQLCDTIEDDEYHFWITAFKPNTNSNESPKEKFVLAKAGMSKELKQKIKKALIEEAQNEKNMR